MASSDLFGTQAHDRQQTSMTFVQVEKDREVLLRVPAYREPGVHVAVQELRPDADGPASPTSPTIRGSATSSPAEVKRYLDGRIVLRLVVAFRRLAGGRPCPGCDGR